MKCLLKQVWQEEKKIILNAMYKYLKVCRYFRHLQLRNENRYEGIVCNILLINWNSLFYTQMEEFLDAKHVTVISTYSSAYTLHL
jgi:hypothetical protein